MKLNIPKFQNVEKHVFLHFQTSLMKCESSKCVFSGMLQTTDIIAKTKGITGFMMIFTVSGLICAHKKYIF